MSSGQIRALKDLLSQLEVAPTTCEDALRAAMSILGVAAEQLAPPESPEARDFGPSAPGGPPPDALLGLSRAPGGQALIPEEPVTVHLPSPHEAGESKVSQPGDQQRPVDLSISELQCRVRDCHPLVQHVIANAGLIAQRNDRNPSVVKDQVLPGGWGHAMYVDSGIPEDRCFDIHLYNPASHVKIFTDYDVDAGGVVVRAIRATPNLTPTTLAQLVKAGVLKAEFLRSLDEPIARAALALLPGLPAAQANAGAAPVMLRGWFALPSGGESGRRGHVELKDDGAYVSYSTRASHFIVKVDPAKLPALTRNLMKLLNHSPSSTASLAALMEQYASRATESQFGHNGKELYELVQKWGIGKGRSC